MKFYTQDGVSVVETATNGQYVGNCTSSISPSGMVTIEINNNKFEILPFAEVFQADGVTPIGTDLATAKSYLVLNTVFNTAAGGSVALVRNFEQRIINDGGILEAKDCLYLTSRKNAKINKKASLIITPNAYKESKLYAVKPIDGSGDLTWTRASIKTRVNSDSLVQSLGVNIPSIDFTGGGCPSILVEPQRTNLVTYSEQFNNAAWAKEAFGGSFSPIVTPNTTIAPDNNLTADTVFLDINTSGNCFVRQLLSELSGTTYTFSVWLKGNGVNKIGLAGSNLLKSTITPTGQWEKYTITWTASSTSSKRFGLYLQSSIASSTTVFVWGAQLEVGSDATSYIPTVSSTVTRVADVGTVTTPVGVTEITETFDDGTTNIITSIPVTYQLPNGRIKQVVMI